MTKALIAVHGFMTDPTDFGKLNESVQKLYDCVEFYEAPGHGSDIANKKGFTRRNVINKLFRLYDKLAKQYDTIDVIGFSMGGALSTLLVANRDVNKVVLLSPSNKYINAYLGYDIYRYTRVIYRDVYRQCQGGRIAKAKQTKRYINWLLVDVLDSFKLGYKIVLKSSPQYLNQFMGLMRACNRHIKGRKFDIPALIVRGDMDQLVPMASVNYVARHFSNARLHTVSGMGHLILPSSHGEALIKLITDFLAEEN